VNGGADEGGRREQRSHPLLFSGNRKGECPLGLGKGEQILQLFSEKGLKPKYLVLRTETKRWGAKEIGQLPNHWPARRGMQSIERVKKAVLQTWGGGGREKGVLGQ